MASDWYPNDDPRSTQDANGRDLGYAGPDGKTLYYRGQPVKHGEWPAIEARIIASAGMPRPTTPLEQAAVNAVADLRMLAREAGETDPKTSPALRAAQRLRDAIMIERLTPSR